MIIDPQAMKVTIDGGHDAAARQASSDAAALWARERAAICMLAAAPISPGVKAAVEEALQHWSGENEELRAIAVDGKGLALIERAQLTAVLDDIGLGRIQREHQVPELMFADERTKSELDHLRTIRAATSLRQTFTEAITQQLDDTGITASPPLSSRPRRCGPASPTSLRRSTRWPWASPKARIRHGAGSCSSSTTSPAEWPPLVAMRFSRARSTRTSTPSMGRPGGSAAERTSALWSGKPAPRRSLPCATTASTASVRELIGSSPACEARTRGYG
ncbi:hypothetical protein [Nocardia asteroides]|uniref:hypothetical protein n=1 Tax=Nocardia asteroides TaxID=1824 RepID=UPI0033CB1F9A